MLTSTNLTSLAGDDGERAALEKASTSIAALLSQVTGVKPYPAIAHRIRKLASNPKTTVPELAQAVESDVALATRVLRLVNSAAMGLSTKVTTIKHAVALLGTRAVAELASAAGALDVVQDGSPEARVIFEHALGSAAVARELAPFSGVAADDAFTAALLHDLGELLLLQSGDTAARERLARGVDRAERVRQERAQLGFDHAALGAAVLESWRVPAPIPEVVLRHHEWEGTSGRAPEIRKLVAVLRVADILTSRLAANIEPSESDLDALRDEPGLEHLALTPDVILRMWPQLVAAERAGRAILSGSNAATGESGAAAPAKERQGLRVVAQPPPTPRTSVDSEEEAPRSLWQRFLSFFRAAA